MAGFFAAKEAFSKYRGSGIRGFALKDVEVVHDKLGKPKIFFKGRPSGTELSISHSRTMAVAVVCGEEHPMGNLSAEEVGFYRDLLPKRWSTMHKGDCGRVFLVAGSCGMVGAAALCGEAALRSGSGLVTVGTPKSVQPTLAVKLTEAMTLPLPEEEGKLSPLATEEICSRISSCDGVAIGPGLGRTEEMWRMIREALRCGKPLVLDADGLNALSEHIDILKEAKSPVVLTPHPGEMERLCGHPVGEAEETRREVASSFATRWGVTLVLKGHRTVIASPQGEVHVNPTGNSGMASGGMGDVLTGIIVSLLGQGMSGYQGAVLGTFLHGLAGDLAALEVGERSLLAGDVIRHLPAAFRTLEKP